MLNLKLAHASFSSLLVSTKIYVITMDELQNCRVKRRLCETGHKACKLKSSSNCLCKCISKYRFTTSKIQFLFRCWISQWEGPKYPNLNFYLFLTSLLVFLLIVLCSLCGSLYTDTWLFWICIDYTLATGRIKFIPGLKTRCEMLTLEITNLFFIYLKFLIS